MSARRGFFAGSALQKTRPDSGRGLPKCGRCRFFEGCENARMAVSGTGKNGIMIVGEIPGEDEDARGAHFVGEGGVLLREALHDAGIKYSDCWRTYAMICRSPSGTFTDKNVSACRPTLLRSLDELRPKVVILLGPAPVRSVMPSLREASVGSHKRWVGFSIPTKNSWLCPTWAPWQIFELGEDGVAAKLWRDHLRHAASLVGVKSPALDATEVKNRVELITSTGAARARLADLAQREGRLAFDYEANRAKPDHPDAKLLAVSFCLEGEDTFSILLRDDSLYRELSRVLKNPKLHKIASNLQMEERWTRAKLGHPVASWWHDTMLAAHVIDNRKEITSIKFQFYLYFGVADYNKHVDSFMRNDKHGFNRLHEMDQRDLLTYNAIDSLAEYLVAIPQRRQLKLKETP